MPALAVFCGVPCRAVAGILTHTESSMRPSGGGRFAIVTPFASSSTQTVGLRWPICSMIEDFESHHHGQYHPGTLALAMWPKCRCSLTFRSITTSSVKLICRPSSSPQTPALEDSTQTPAANLLKGTKSTANPLFD
ncbi:hypothetical protein BDW69DRAFT_141495 [Aspergillus filifer]